MGKQKKKPDLKRKKLNFVDLSNVYVLYDMSTYWIYNDFDNEKILIGSISKTDPRAKYFEALL